MVEHRFRLTALARALAAGAVIGLAGLSAAPASAALSSSEAADAAVLAELIVNATLQANATPDNPQTTPDETRGAIESAVETAIEGFQNGQASPDVVSEALFLAKAKLVKGAQWCPGAINSTKAATKSRAAPETERACAMSLAFSAISNTVQAAQDSAPSAIDGAAGPSAIPPPSGLSGGGGGVTHTAAQ
jgi:hypothetical protein